MINEIKQSDFDKLPNRVKIGLKSIDRNPGSGTEIWLHEQIPALGNKSVMHIFTEQEDAEARLVAYCTAVKGKSI